jgi:hypothetical protein
MIPADITAALGLEPRFAHCVGEHRKTPTGALLDGVYSDTRWRHSIRYDVKNQWFADKVTLLVDHLMNCKEFITRLRSSGGEAMIVVQFLGDGYFGDKVSLDTLRRITDLQLDFGIECFAAPQS